MRVLITGGTGRLARHIFSHRDGAGISWRVLSRKAPRSAGGHQWVTADLLTGAGLDAAVAGVDAVLHLASDPASPSADVEAARQLTAAARAGAVRHLAYLSIVGIDRNPYPYYQAKLAAERVVEGGGVPWSILRAAQFHSFVDWLCGRAVSLPLVAIVPAGIRVQSVDDSEVAGRLIGVLRGGPGGRVRDFAGPQVLSAAEALAEWKRARGVRRPTVRVPVFGPVAAAFKRGDNTAPDADRGTVTWGEWLKASAAGGSASPS